MKDPDGQSLSAATGRPWPVEAWLAVAGQLADALAALHARGRLHLQLRPGCVRWLPATCETRLGEPEAAPTAPWARLPADWLRYRAPELSGRIEAAVDARSDLYALGALLYELATGRPPFEADDALALLHAHIAQPPAEPVLRRPEWPPLLSALLMKLLAKAPEDRYPTARALAHDIRRCREAWAAAGRIAPFALARRDADQSLVVPPRLMGREAEQRLLEAAFERTCRGAGPPGLVLVEGYAGIGKTALIQQLVRPIVQRRGHFVAGKFDQVARGVPFGALVQALRALVRQLLTESEAHLAAWRARLLDALGGNGGVLAEVMPEIAFVIGPQPAPAALGSTEAQNRFQRVLQSFLATLAQPEHPLVLFLDDLQWADAATLALLEPLLAAGGIRGLLVIGACREHEPDTAPRLAPTLAALQAAGVGLQRLNLGALALPELTQLVADTLRSELAHAAPLAAMVLQKTGGNPFFVIQFLQALAAEGRLHFDEELQRWSYRIEQLAAAPLAQNVVELMTRRIRSLPADTQALLTLAACLGSRFERDTLALVSAQPRIEADRQLAAALAAGLVQDAGDGAACAFLHDRVQQAAYGLIAPGERPALHLRVGRLLRDHGSAEEREARLFDTVHHLNRGHGLLADRAERRGVAALNLAAGRRAKAATAHDSALELLAAGCLLLDDAAWLDEPALAFELALEHTESLYLCGRFDAAFAAQDALLARARGPVQRARVLRLRSVQHENMARYADALATALDALAPFGIELPATDWEQAAALAREIDTIATLRRDRAIEALIDLPELHDEGTALAMGMLTEMWSSAYILGHTTLARLISATLVRLSLQRGQRAESAYGYVTHAITVGAVRGDLQEAHAFGRLALAVNQRFDDTRRRAKVFQQFHAHVAFWCEPYAACLPYAQAACRSGLDNGDFLYAAYGAATGSWAALAATQDLAAFVAEQEPQVALVEKLNNRAFADGVRVIVAAVQALRGLTAAPLSLDGPSFDEAAWLQRYRDQPFFAGVHAVMRLQLAVLLGTPPQALQAARHAQALMPHLTGTVWPLIHGLWFGLALADSGDHLPEPARQAQRAELHAVQQDYARWAAGCAQNFRVPALLLGAECAAAEGRQAEALAACDAAIEFAAEQGLLAQEALAHERAARLRRRQGQPRLAALHTQQAVALYARWGAFAKVRALDPAAAPPVTVPAAAADGLALAPATDDHSLDHASVLKAGQAIAGLVAMDALLERLLQIALENAGAERGALVLLEGSDGPQVHACHGGGPLRRAGALEGCDELPQRLVHFVRRTGAPLVLGAPTTDEPWASEPWLQHAQPRSLACLPVAQQGRLVAVLVLEHRGVAGLFTPARLRTLQVLAAQAAVALENARLVAELEAENRHLRRDLVANVSHDLRTPLAALRGYLELLASGGERLPAAQREQYLGVALRQSEHLATLIDELFELAKLDFKGVELQREPFCLADLASDVMHKFQLDAQARQVTLAVEAAPGLPWVDADLSLIERVMDNLVGNALRHTPPGGCVSLRATAADGRVRAEVCDTGCGIAPADLPHVFDRYYRGRAGPRAGGAGLGLAITKRILELHGAAVQVVSRAGEGACFGFSLPTASPPHR